jgi:hypothetical protein
MDCKEKFTYGQLCNTGFVAFNMAKNLQILNITPNFTKNLARFIIKKMFTAQKHCNMQQMFS